MLLIRLPTTLVLVSRSGLCSLMGLYLQRIWAAGICVLVLIVDSHTHMTPTRSYETNVLEPRRCSGPQAPAGLYSPGLRRHGGESERSSDGRRTASRDGGHSFGEVGGVGGAGGWEVGRLGG